ncbi:MAG: glycosyltransferase, partial [Alistipes sp.]|nr:glycosyltransferase [Alistipes sp.]
QIGGIPEIIDEDRTGYLFPSGGVQELKEAIIKAESLSEEGYTEMSRAARTFAAENFSEEHSYTKIMNLYNSILKDYER